MMFLINKTCSRVLKKYFAYIMLMQKIITSMAIDVYESYMRGCCKSKIL